MRVVRGQRGGRVRGGDGGLMIDTDKGVFSFVI